ncbi:hypothetical protein [Cellulomonas sp. URHD0024]|uniref:hypothetical protein n=1 Tax=Cellulomonas sp. URHD0024 TaxID=1302620 RepID=UPI000425D4CC|nr:hypothetical protein [Cellulomonas sp. URHD0024]
MPILVAIFVALLVAGGVLLVASVVSTRRDRRTSPLAALRAGLTGQDHPDAEVGEAAAAEPVDLSLADFLRATVEEGDPYLHVDDLTATLHDARAKAAGVLRR